MLSQSVGAFVRLALIGPVYPYRDGIAHFTTGLYRALQMHGHEVLLVSFSRQYPQRLFPGQTDKDPSQKPGSVEDARYWLDSRNPLAWISTFARIRRSAPEAIVMQWWTTFWAPAWFVLGILNRILLRVPMVYFCHNVLPHEMRRWDRWLAKLALRQAMAFVVQSAAEKNQLLSLIPGAQIQISCLPTFDMLASQRICCLRMKRAPQNPIQNMVLGWAIGISRAGAL